MKAYRNILAIGLSILSLGITTRSSFARDVEYKDSEVSVYVAPGEPTQIRFPGTIAGGFKKKSSSLNLDRKGTDLIVFGQESLSDAGEAIIVRLEDGRSFSMRVHRASKASPRDDMVKVDDVKGAMVKAGADDEEEPAYKEKQSDYAPPTQVSGLMREMMLNAEFGKTSISGYRVSETHKGEIVLNDGTINAKVDKIYVGPTMWGYVLDAENLLDTSQKLNPASFRIDGTRAISAKEWEITARPMNVEQQVAGKHKTKVYIITRAKK
jgi:hypothetical protein